LSSSRRFIVAPSALSAETSSNSRREGHRRKAMHRNPSPHLTRRRSLQLLIRAGQWRGERIGSRRRRVTRCSVKRR
jgi:hypothetical protein